MNHPLDPLSESEIELARNIISERFGDESGIRFSSLVLAEPNKQKVRNYRERL